MPDPVGLQPGEAVSLVFAPAIQQQDMATKGYGVTNTAANVIRNFFYASRISASVIVNSKMVFGDGDFVGFDEADMLVHINEASLALLARMGKTIEPNQVSRPGRQI